MFPPTTSLSEKLDRELALKHTKIIHQILIFYARTDANQLLSEQGYIKKGPMKNPGPGNYFNKES